MLNIITKQVGILLATLFLTNVGTAWAKEMHITKKHTVDEAIFTNREKLAIYNVVANAQKLRQFERLELTVGLSATYDNPFDPDDVNIEGHFISSNGKQLLFLDSFIKII